MDCGLVEENGEGCMVVRGITKVRQSCSFANICMVLCIILPATFTLLFSAIVSTYCGTDVAYIPLLFLGEK